MSVTDQAVTEVMALIPTQHLRAEAVYCLRNQIYYVLFKYAAKKTDELRSKINELDRQLYIAKKQIEDDAVDPAGFNK